MFSFCQFTDTLSWSWLGYPHSPTLLPHPAPSPSTQDQDRVPPLPSHPPGQDQERASPTLSSQNRVHPPHPCPVPPSPHIHDQVRVPLPCPVSQLGPGYCAPCPSLWSGPGTGYPQEDFLVYFQLSSIFGADDQAIFLF